MAGEPVPRGPWPRGINNRQPDGSVPLDALRNAVNVDIDNSGRVRVMAGITKVYAGNGVTSLTGNPLGTFFVEGGALKKLDTSTIPAATATVLRTGIGPNVAYEYANGELFYSDGTVTGKIKADGSQGLWGIPVPLAPVVFGTAGGLPGGKYTVYTAATDGVEESGASEPVQVSLPSFGGLRVQTAPTGAVGLTRVYATTANGDAFYYVGTVASGGALDVTTLPGSGRNQNPEFVAPPPAGTIIRFFRGRLFIVVGAAVYWTEPYQPGRVDYSKNFWPFPAAISVFEPVADGFWLVSDVTYWIPCDDPAKSQAVRRLEYGAIAGTGVRIPSTGENPAVEKVLWMSQRGVCRGEDGGSVVNLQEANVAIRPGVQGAALVREQNGLRQYLATYPPSGTSPMQASTWATAEVIRKGF
jgi:hypothetical protein